MVPQSMGFMMRGGGTEKKQSHAPRMERKCNNHDILVNKKRSERGPKQDLSNGSRNCGDSVAMVWGRDHRDLVGN